MTGVSVRTGRRRLHTHGRILAAVIAPLFLWVAWGGVRAQPPAGFDLALVNVDGTKTVLGQLPPSVFAPRLSPDGTRIAFETRDTSTPDGARLWVAEVADFTRRTSLATAVGRVNWAPVWSVDGQRLVFLATSERPDALYWRRVDGAGGAEYLVDARSAEGWIGNGAQLRVLTLTGNRDYGISLLDMTTRKATTLIDLPGSAQHSSAVSPDGRWMAYASNETGRYEVWLEPLPRTGSRYQLTRDGGGHPMWLPDGRSIYFERQQKIFRLGINPSAPDTRVEPVPLPVRGFVQGELRRQFDMMPDGTRFLMLFAL
jgi:Tol biopolymer transport system component